MCFCLSLFAESVDTNAYKSKLSWAKIECGVGYTLLLLSNGHVFACGRNEHGRMGIDAGPSEVTTPVQIRRLSKIIDISAAEYHSGFVSKKGELFTCGLGTLYRLGQANENTYWNPTLVPIGSEPNIANVECVQSRTFAITKDDSCCYLSLFLLLTIFFNKKKKKKGCVLMWGKEPVTETIYKEAKILQYLRAYRIRTVCGGKDFVIAMGHSTRTPVVVPKIVTNDSNAYSCSYTSNIAPSDIGAVISKATPFLPERHSFEVRGNYVTIAPSYSESFSSDASLIPPPLPPPLPPVPSFLLQRSSPNLYSNPTNLQNIAEQDESGQLSSPHASSFNSNEIHDEDDEKQHMTHETFAINYVTNKHQRQAVNIYKLFLIYLIC
ncbi:hypothetical protein RFI_31187 [Reticulomyxa filosa]|uniref:Uncharacterized protein n=1 Tax=Reticulomyxa filosa TaxID=46433 RepID=X6LW85_RETFI|nr:hypothetical protein RFI_31187 [Reticulomyxa filosa]|eukprot:ETO06213.1 hypothetical protein RFI_31187 [Reticulomyxa filosa]